MPVAKRLGLGSTASTTYFEPFHVARAFQTLDLMSDGRAAWNIVTPLSRIWKEWDQASDKDAEICFYEAGSWGPENADRLIAWGLPLSFVVLGTLIVAGPAAGAGTLALFCVSSTFVSLAQPAVGMVFPASLAGRALSAYNLVIFLGVFVVQWGIGLVIDAFRAGGLGEVDAFRAAFSVFLATSVLSYAWFLWSRSHNRRQSP